ncbi:MAG: response regulator [Nitrospirota bacterium]|nr:MAG: response regulator [Nitrospirota bacterium]
MTDQGEKKVLVVDDSATMRMLITMTIKKSISGVSVIEALNGADAQDKLQSNKVDLVLTDVNMPKMNGWELVKWIRSSHSKDIPVVIITTEGAEEEIEEGKALGANAYITKPVKSQELKDTIQGLL